MAFTTWRRVVTPPARRECRVGVDPRTSAIPEDGPLAAVPPGLSFRDVAPGIEGAHYALSIIRKAGLRRPGAGQDVLANGATGAIGSAVQLLADLCARVTAVFCGKARWRWCGGLAPTGSSTGTRRTSPRTTITSTSSSTQSARAPSDGAARCSSPAACT